MCVDGIQEWAQHAALWRTRTEHEGGGAVGANFNRLRRFVRKSFIKAQVAGGKSRAASLLTRMSGMMVLKAEQ